MAETKKPTYRADLDKLRRLPDHIKRHPYFCLWKWEYKNNRWTKVPYNPRTGGHAQPNNRSTFSTLDATLDAYQRGGYDGVGIGLFDGMSGVDIDHHLNDGKLDEFAQTIVDGMSAYTEVSPRGDGVHVLFSCPAFSDEFDRKKYEALYMFNKRDIGLETYVCGITKRFFTITGRTLSVGEGGDKSDQLRHVLDTHMKRNRKRRTNKGGTSTRKRISMSDRRLIEKAKEHAKNGAKFAALWEGDLSGYESPSEADQALCNLLTWWTNHDMSRVDHLFRQSKLNRAKWEERDDYRTWTLNKADEDVEGGYDPAGYRARKQAEKPIEVHAEVIEAEVASLRETLADDALDRALLASKVLTKEPNDLNLGRAFAMCFKGVVRYVAEAETFYVFDGTRWAQDTKSSKRALKLCGRFYDRLLLLAAAAIKDQKQRNAFIDGLMMYGTHGKRMSILKDAASELLASLSDFDQDLDLFNCENVTLDLKRMKSRPHEARDMITKVANVRYDRDATSELWETHIATALEGDVDVMSYLQQQLGLALTGDTSQERMHVCQGIVRSGKTTTLETVNHLFGDYSRGVAPATITKQRRSGQNASGDLARLEGVRLAVVPDPQMNLELSAEVVKQITGNDTITARQLYQSERDFRPVASLWVGTNHELCIDDPTVVQSDRIVVIPFNHHVPLAERDKTLKTRLRESDNLSGILNWLIDGLRDYRTEPAPVPSAVREKSEEFAANCDRIATFAEECLVADDEAFLSGAKCFSRYEAWAKSSSIEPEGKQAFFADLRRLNLLRNKWRGLCNVVAGYRLAEQ